MKYVSSCTSTQSAGVMTLFNNSYECHETYKDSQGRFALVVLENEIEKLIVANIYAPCDPAIAMGFIESVYDKLYEVMDRHEDGFLIMGGDFNACMDTSLDSLNRTKTVSECRLTDFIKANNETCEIEDSYRSKMDKGGFTWSRGSCQSRLDYIFISRYLISKISNVETDWAFEQSDHASVTVEINIDQEIKVGPGLTRINSIILEDPVILERVRRELKEMLNQIPQNWNPHDKLEFMKVAIRSVISANVGFNRKELNNEIKDLEKVLNEMCELKSKACSLDNEEEKLLKIELIDGAINRTNSDLKLLREKRSAETNFRAKAKWSDLGEKSNKYFLNLNKKFTKQKIIGNIICDDVRYRGQEGVKEGITKFYEKLYNKVEIDNSEDDFYDKSPKLSNNSSVYMDSELTEVELFEALKTCNDSAPGSDGISYGVYKKLWNITGPYIINSWNYSYEIGHMAPSHKESIIVLLPKDGKDSSDIKNWRPITLSNCDSKIITKALSNRMAKVLGEIIDESQTAYVKGRSIMDNLRSIKFIKEHCIQEEVDSVLISLDAKKAFDSVDHKYIENTLKNYGFGNRFIRFFRTIYKDITAKILINGHLSRIIRILRGMKQGDALSCAIFIICIDPLIRNLNSHNEIKAIELTTSITGENVNYKAGAFADDVGAVCKGDIKSVQNVFTQYEKLTRKSGLELNADKTEILVLGSNRIRLYKVKYMGREVTIRTISELKICGIWFCNNLDKEYHLNINEKILKMGSILKSWKNRNLTYEGKSLIIKTFGLSQLVYVLQACEIRSESIKKIEQMIFGFLWLGSRSDKEKGVDRIKRSVLKNDYSQGGLNITDIECLNRSLKLRQFLRAAKSGHSISIIQRLCLEKLGYTGNITQEYEKITKKEEITKTAQQTINILCDYMRSTIIENRNEAGNDCKSIKFIATLDIRTFLIRKNRQIINSLYAPLRRGGVVKLFELCTEAEIEQDENILVCIGNVISEFPECMVELAGAYDENSNNDSSGMSHLLYKWGEWRDINCITTKELQVMLKRALNKIDKLDFSHRLGYETFNPDQIEIFRGQCKNVKLRHIYYRLISRDFYTKERMLRFKMSRNDECERCGLKETYRHLLWECRESRLVWSSFNGYLNSINFCQSDVNKYEDIFNIDKNKIISIVKIRVIQAMIQIERPKNWNIETVRKIALELKRMEIYNSIVNLKGEKTRGVWESIK
jgi:exonuclease III